MLREIFNLLLAICIFCAAQVPPSPRQQLLTRRQILQAQRRTARQQILQAPITSQPLLPSLPARNVFARFRPPLPSQPRPAFVQDRRNSIRRLPSVLLNPIPLRRPQPVLQNPALPPRRQLIPPPRNPLPTLRQLDASASSPPGMRPPPGIATQLNRAKLKDFMQLGASLMHRTRRQRRVPGSSATSAQRRLGSRRRARKSLRRAVFQ